MPLPLLTFPGLARVPGLRHGVTTREGGVSTGSWRSLNLGRSTGDRPEAVAENGRRVAAALGADRVRFPHQVHGVVVRVVASTDAGPLGEADAVATAEPGVALGVLGADCPGIVLADPVRRTLAVVHSGWRGTVAGVAPAAVRVLVERFGSRPEDLVAGIGPGISARSYEVGPEVADAVRSQVPDGERAISKGRGDRAHVDLSLAIRAQLVACGVRADAIEAMALCTVEAEDVLFSHRRDGAGAGRHGLVAMWARDGS